MSVAVLVLYCDQHVCCCVSAVSVVLSAACLLL